MSFLKQQLRECESWFQREVLCASAKIYQESGMTKEAVACYYRAGEYEAILPCGLVCLIMDDFDGIPYTDSPHHRADGIEIGAVNPAI